MRPDLDSTLPHYDEDAHLRVDDDDPTLLWERPVFFGDPVGPYPADRPLPPRVAVVVGSTDATRSCR